MTIWARCWWYLPLCQGLVLQQWLQQEPENQSETTDFLHHFLHCQKLAEVHVPISVPLPPLLLCFQELFFQIGDFITKRCILLWWVQTQRLGHETQNMWPHWFLKNEQPTHEYESSGSFTQPQVLQPVLLILSFPCNTLHFALVLWRTDGRGEDVCRGARAWTGTSVLREKRLGCQGLQGLLPLLVGLGKKTEVALKKSVDLKDTGLPEDTLVLPSGRWMRIR